ncbi:MAG: hypothetical protein U1F54_15870 [Burkholderiales bacterium]
MTTRSLAAIFALGVSGFAVAAPFVVSDPVALGVAQCGVYVDSAPSVTIPVTVVATGSICNYDVGGLAPGSHTVAMTAMTLSDPIWGFQESAKSTPLAFILGAATTLIAVEYFHPAFDHYFTTSSVDEITKLDAGVFAGWARTGQSFNVYPTGAAGRVSVCRFFSVSFDPRSSHFYTPLANECATVKQNPAWRFEGEVFSVLLPDSGGGCPAGTGPLYRVYNNGQGGAPNHRYTTSLTTRSAMLGQGWISEGFGLAGVIACVPS